MFGVDRPNTAVQQSPENTEKLHFKKQILDYLLPQMHYLAYFARKPKAQTQFQTLLKLTGDRLEQPYFNSFFASTLAQAARHIKNPYAAYAIKQQFNPASSVEHRIKKPAVTQTDAAFFKRLYAKISKQTAKQVTQHQLIHDCLQACCLGLGFEEAAFFKVEQKN